MTETDQYYIIYRDPDTREYVTKPYSMDLEHTLWNMDILHEIVHEYEVAHWLSTH